jgi:ubiquinone/menaquinone biosynthesis C-methylase UbiE
MDYEEALAARSAADYADFLLPHLDTGSCVIDVGCGAGTITLGLAQAAAHVVGVDQSGDEFADAQQYAAANGIGNVEFRVGTVYRLDYPADSFDACLCHSMLETLERPLDALVEIRRALKSGGVLGVASVEYGGLILGGPNDELLRRFYTVRELVWEREGAADPFRGRALRGLLEQARFESVVATSKYFSYGTRQAVMKFGRARADDCGDGWFSSSAEAHGLSSRIELDAMRRAWLEWSESPDAFAAFAWCRALGWKP